MKRPKPMPVRRGRKPKPARQQKTLHKALPEKGPTYVPVPNDIDPFVVIGEIPRGLSYQWIARAVLGERHAAGAYDQMAARGWKPVPPRRHPKMPSDRKEIVVGDQVLMQRPAAMTSAARDDEQRSAREMTKDNPDSRDDEFKLKTLPNLKPSSAAHIPSTSLRSPSPPKPKPKTLGDSALPSVRGRKYAVFTVEIGLALSENEIAIATDGTLVWTYDDWKTDKPKFGNYIHDSLDKG